MSSTHSTVYRSRSVLSQFVPVRVQSFSSQLYNQVDYLEQIHWLTYG